MGASDLLRITGLNSGMDTESIISAYTSKYQTRIKKAKDKIQLNTWTQDTWKGLNSKIYSFYSSTLAANRLSGAYSKKKVTTSNSALSVVAGNASVNGVMSAKIEGIAKAAYLTGGKVDVSGSDDLIEKLGIEEGKQITFEGKDGKTKTIQIGGTTEDENTAVVNTMDQLANVLKNEGVNANFDSVNQRMFVSAKDTGRANDFNFSGDVETLAKLGIATEKQLDGAGLTEQYKNSIATKIDASNAKLILNGAEFESDSNTFSINGATYTINSMPVNPEEEISITTGTDYDGIYDVVKNMLKEYNELVNEMSKLYNADSSKGYDPLTTEQKSAMSEDEIKDWEDKIKGALLRNDETLYEVMNAMTSSMAEGFEVGGKKMYLSDFGISTLGYFSADENERYALHIDGDKDDSNTAANEDKLKSMIAADPEKVTSFFTQMAQKLYKDIYAKMGSTSMSSIYKVYNDKEMETEKKDWESRLADLESAMSDAEDRYYKRFSAMETALAKINSKQSALSGLFGG